MKKVYKIYQQIDDAVFDGDMFYINELFEKREDAEKRCKELNKTAGVYDSYVIICEKL